MIVAFPYAEIPGKEHSSSRQVAELMIASVRRSMPGVKVVQMADPATPALPVDEVMRKPFNHNFWVPWLVEFLSEIPGEVLFLDSDVIVQRDLSPMFLAKADVVVTYRGPKVMEGRQMPFLFGVVASSTPELWLEVRDRVLAMPNEEDQGWWGQQLAIFDMWQEEKNGRGKWKIASVPCDPYNYVPKSPTDTPADKWVLHFKGPKRKPWMLEKFGEAVAA